MGTTAYGGKGSQGRAANGDRPVGAARCRRGQHTKGVMPTSPPPPLRNEQSRGAQRSTRRRHDGQKAGAAVGQAQPEPNADNATRPFEPPPPPRRGLWPAVSCQRYRPLESTGAHGPRAPKAPEGTFCLWLVQVIDGEYALVLEFKNDDRVPMRQWANRADKFTTFFGPGIRAELGKTEQGVDVALICDGSGAGREGKEQGDVLPPLMPGMPARRVD